MSFGTRLREKREELGLKQSELGKLLGVTGSAIGNYETGTSSPKADVLYRIFDVLKCDANYLFQDEMQTLGEPDFSGHETQLIKKYRTLDERGKELADVVINYEATQVNREPAQQEAEKAAVEPPKPATKIIPLFGNSFAAGRGDPDFGNAWEDYEIQAKSHADFAIRVNGDSMEPYLHNGSIALGQKQTPRDGDVAALLLDGEFLVKQVCQDNFGNLYLFALNRKRKDTDITIWHDSGRNVTCFGTIIMGKDVPLP